MWVPLCSGGLGVPGDSWMGKMKNHGDRESQNSGGKDGDRETGNEVWS